MWQKTNNRVTYDGDGLCACARVPVVSSCTNSADMCKVSPPSVSCSDVESRSFGNTRDSKPDRRTSYEGSSAWGHELVGQKEV